ncbi:glycosyltransferase family 4 protein [Patescibacteria group bacterium]
MKILILNWKDLKHPEVGGAEIIVYELAKRLARDGHDVTWFCRSFKGARQKEVMDNIKIIRKGNIATMIPHAYFYYSWLLKKPDLVIDMSNTIYWQSSVWAKKSKRTAYLNQLAKEVFDYEYNPVLSFLGKTVEKFQYLTYRKTPFICYSESTKEDLVTMGVKKEMVHTFPLGLDQDRYTPGKKSKTPLFFCVSRLVKMKRTNLAIQAFEHVVKKHPDARLCIMGNGYDRIRLDKIRDELNLRDNVFFVDEDNWFF